MSSPSSPLLALLSQLVQAASNGHLKTVQYILALHPELAGAGVGQDAPLIAAAWFGHADCLEALLQHLSREKCTSALGSHEFNALMATALMDSAACMRLLLPYCDANARSSGGLTALMLCAAHNALECLNLLLPRCDPRARDPEGRSAFDYALRDRQWACLDRLAPYASGQDVHRALLAAQGNPLHLHTATLLPQCTALCEQEALAQCLSTESGPAPTRAGVRNPTSDLARGL